MDLAERITLSLFLLGLVACILGGFQILYALAFGLVCFVVYGLLKKHTPRQMVTMMLDGIRGAKNILIIFLLIGILTSVWRSSGTIPFLIYHAVQVLNPSFFVLYTFLLCCMMSFLMGTSFGTAATMGVVCMMISRSLGIDPVLSGGAILAGSYFGDRCSPMSSSALLVSELTDTNIYDNIRRMLKTAAIPFALSCLLYLVARGASSQTGSVASLDMFREHFNLSFVVVLPALLIIILSLFRVPVKRTMLLSILVAGVICLTVQKIPLTQLLPSLLLGYESPNDELAALLNGGGILSMAKVAGIILISTSYFGIFKQTELLTEVRRLVEASASKITPFGSVLFTSVVMSAISCNQTLATMLTFQMCDSILPDRKKLAIVLEDTVIVIAPLIPWSIAGGMPLTTVGAPTMSIWFAFYLFLLPIFSFGTELLLNRKNKQTAAEEIAESLPNTEGSK